MKSSGSDPSNSHPRNQNAPSSSSSNLLTKKNSSFFTSVINTLTETVYEKKVNVSLEHNNNKNNKTNDNNNNNNNTEKMDAYGYIQPKSALNLLAHKNNTNSCHKKQELSSYSSHSNNQKLILVNNNNSNSKFNLKINTNHEPELDEYGYIKKYFISFYFIANLYL